MDRKIKIGSNVEKNVLDKYSAVLPKELIEIWKTQGYCSLLNGYLRMINPDEYKELLNDTYFYGKNSIPILTTAFGDIITFEDDQYIGIVKYKNGTFHIIAKNFKRFWQNLEEDCFLDDYFDYLQFTEAVERLGNVNHNECFAYVPLLGLGGNEKVENLKKVKTKEHIELVTQMIGIVGK